MNFNSMLFLEPLVVMMNIFFKKSQGAFIFIKDQLCLVDVEVLQCFCSYIYIRLCIKPDVNYERLLCVSKM